MPKKQTLNIEEVEEYVEESELGKWVPGQINYILDSAFSQEHQGICAINLVVGKRRLIYRIKDYNNIFLVWKNKDGNIKHCVIMKDVQDMEYVRTESVVVSQAKITVRIFCVDNDGRDFVINAHFPIEKIA